MPADAIVNRRAQDGYNRCGFPSNHASLSAFELDERHLGFSGAKVVEEGLLDIALLWREVHGSLHRKGSTLVHQGQDTEASNLASSHDGLTLAQVCLWRYGDHYILHGLAVSRSLSHLLREEKNVGQDLFPTEGLVLAEVKGRYTALGLIHQIECVELFV